MIYVTADTHGKFDPIAQFCEEKKTKKEDVIIILGDAGINFGGGEKDQKIKELIASLPVTLFCIHGNHEQRPQTIASYREREWNDGIVFSEDRYPNILFAKDGEIFDLNGKKSIAIGGACSIGKEMRIARGHRWWPDEQPSPEIKHCVEKRLASCNWSVDAVLSHTLPLKYEPSEAFLPGIDQRTVDCGTEQWLDAIEYKLNYNRWYCGHYHIRKQIGRLKILYKNIIPFMI